MKNSKNQKEKKAFVLPKLDKKMILIGTAGLALMLIFCLCLVLANSRKVIAIYGLEKNQTEATQACLSKICEENKL
ncbi:MAG: hypothetical protein KBT11_09525, partial [Treponema sp.]|nr:hypothetical protein [Candidatus Treponema equifaecale]